MRLNWIGHRWICSCVFKRIIYLHQKLSLTNLKTLIFFKIKIHFHRVFSTSNCVDNPLNMLKPTYLLIKPKFEANLRICTVINKCRYKLRVTYNVTLCILSGFYLTFAENPRKSPQYYNPEYETLQAVFQALDRRKIPIAISPLSNKLI